MLKKVILGLAAALSLVVLASRTVQSAAPAGLGSCHVVSQNNVVADTVVLCPAGEIAVGGGGRCTDPSGDELTSALSASYPSGQGWATTCSSPRTAPRRVQGQTFAVCCRP